MYAFVEGIVELKEENNVVLNNNGIGYDIYVSTNTVANLPNVGEKAKIYTYLHVREDAFLLFGFANMQEKKMFLELINVSGIGAKMAITVLSSLSVHDLIIAIVSGDVQTLSKAKGIGKKTAERVVLELKNKFGDFALSETINTTNLNTENSCITEAVNLLITMGLTKYDAVNLVKRVYTDSDTTETIIAKSLRNMSN